METKDDFVKKVTQSMSAAEVVFRMIGPSDLDPNAKVMGPIIAAMAYSAMIEASDKANFPMKEYFERMEAVRPLVLGIFFEGMKQRYKTDIFDDALAMVKAEQRVREIARAGAA